MNNSDKMRTTPYLKDAFCCFGKLSTNIQSFIVFKTCACGTTGDPNNKNGRTVGVIYKDGRRIDCVYND